MSTVQRLGERLVAAELLTAPQLEEALAKQRERGGYLPEVLADEGYLDEASLLSFLAEGGGSITSDQLSKARPAVALLESFVVGDAERLNVMPLAYDGRAQTLVVAVTSLEADSLEEVRQVSGARRVKPLLALRRGVAACIQRCYYNDPYAFVWLERRPAAARRVIAAAEDFLARIAPAPVHSSGLGSQPQLTVAGSPESTVARLQAELEAARREAQVLRVANALSVHLARERDVFELLQRVLAFAFDNVPADEGALLLKDATTGELKPCATRSSGAPHADGRVSATLIDQLVKTREPVLAADAAYDPLFWQSKTVALESARSLMGVPIVIRGEVEGAITLVSYQRAAAFSPQDLNVLTGIAAQTSIALENLNLSRRVAANAQVRDRLARFLSPALVELAAAGSIPLGEDGGLQEATVLFADIRGFTALAESLDPKQVVQLLNRFFDGMVEVVFSRGGILDKFIGDGLMALWGVPLQRPDDPERALRAALEMRERSRALAAARAAAGETAYDIGIGIHHGRVVFGAMGAVRRLELTAVGDPVNVAARLCASAAPGQIIVSQAALDRAGAGFKATPLAPMSLRGRAHPTPVFALDGA